MSLIEQICGNYPEGFKKLDISSDPNYVFVNDPSYSARQLFDIDGNKVFVNSFIECEHYVSGGMGFFTPKESRIIIPRCIFIFYYFWCYCFIFKPKIKEYFQN